MAVCFSAPQPLQDEVHPLLFLSVGEPCGKQHDCPVPAAVGRDDPPAAGTSTHLNLRFSWHSCDGSPAVSDVTGEVKLPPWTGALHCGRPAHTITRYASSGVFRSLLQRPLPATFRMRRKFLFLNPRGKGRGRRTATPVSSAHTGGVNTGATPVFVRLAFPGGAAPAVGHGAGVPRGDSSAVAAGGRCLPAMPGHVGTAPWWSSFAVDSGVSWYREKGRDYAAIGSVWFFRGRPRGRLRATTLPLTSN